MDGLKYQIWYEVNISCTGTNPDFKKEAQRGENRYSLL